MNGYLLDTNALSEVLKKRPAESVISRMRSVPSEQLMTSSICVMELRYGAARRPDGGALWQRIAEAILPRVRVLPLGGMEATRAGDFLVELERRGEPIGLEDIQIAATAVERGLVLVTRNLRHFERIAGLTVESWWE